MVNRKDERYIRMVFELAKDIEPVRGSRMAAMLVKGKTPVAYGFNHKKSNPFQARFAKKPEAVYFHAEVHAIKNALRTISVEDLKQCTLYIARAKKGDGHSSRRHWHYGEAKPCSGCANCINEFELKSVVYTTDKQMIEKQ